MSHIKEPEALFNPELSLPVYEVLGQLLERNAHHNLLHLHARVLHARVARVYLYYILVFQLNVEPFVREALCDLPHEWSKDIVRPAIFIVHVLPF